MNFFRSNSYLVKRFNIRYLRTTFVLATFFIAGFLIYSNTLEVPFYFDDLSNILRNSEIRLTELSLKGIAKAGFESILSTRPTANISFALNYYFNEYNVKGYHIVNILIHIINGTLLFFIIKIILSLSSENHRYKHQVLIAFFAALIWLVHPIQTQSVTYIVQRMNSMASMFYLISFLFYLIGRIYKRNQNGWLWYTGSVVAGGLALSCKEHVVILPLIIFIFEWYFFQNLRITWLKRHFPYYGLGWWKSDTFNFP